MIEIAFTAEELLTSAEFGAFLGSIENAFGRTRKTASQEYEDQATLAFIYAEKGSEDER
jgi:hypothetical protein